MKRVILMLAITLLLAGCGSRSSFVPIPDTSGGSGGNSNDTPLPSEPNATPGEAQGVYSVAYDDIDLTSYSIVLPNDMYYEIAARTGEDGSVAEVWVLRTGQGKSASGTYTANLTHFFEGESMGMSLSAQYVPLKSLTGSIRFLSTGATHAFTATALKPASIDFDVPASLSQIAGTWQAWGLCDVLTGGAEGGCDPYILEIREGGELTIAGQDCTYAILTPDASHNFFEVEVPVGEGACNTGATAGSGAAIEMLLPSGSKRQLLVAGAIDGRPILVVAQR